MINVHRFSLTDLQTAKALSLLLPSQVITGGKKFIAQLNENWRSNILMDLEKKIFQSLSPIRSSYMKTHREDVLFCVSSGEKEGSELVYSTVLPKDGILIIANVSTLADVFTTYYGASVQFELFIYLIFF